MKIITILDIDLTFSGCSVGFPLITMSLVPRICHVSSYPALLLWYQGFPHEKTVVVFLSLCVFLLCSLLTFKQLLRIVSAKFSRFWAKWSSTIAQAELRNHAGHQAAGISAHNRKRQSPSVHNLTSLPAAVFIPLSLKEHRLMRQLYLLNDQSVDDAFR